MKHRTLIDGLLQAFEARDLDSVMAFFHETAVVIDPHYPIATMTGYNSIRQGFQWAMGNMVKPGFNILQFWSGEHSGAFEVDTHHVFKGGMEIRFKQVFVFELAHGKLSALRAYAPYPPPGLVSLLLKITRVIWRFSDNRS